jgi:citrate synthase
MDIGTRWIVKAFFRVIPYFSTNIALGSAGATGALYGPFHEGVNEAVLDLFTQIFRLKIINSHFLRTRS